MAEPSVLELAAHAKVNLALAVTGRRADGYHELRSVFLRLELADTLTVSPLASVSSDLDPAAPDRLVTQGDPDCPVADNLVLRAAVAFRAVAAAERGVDVPGVDISLTKRIPMSAGLAGGSTDAASMLRLLAARHPGVFTRAEMGALAARVGADVPFFVDGAGAALVRGRGELIEPLPPPIDPVGVLLCTPPVGASTPMVFRAWDEQPAGGRANDATGQAVADLAHLLRAGVDPGALADHATSLREANDLWLPAAAVTPGLAALRDSLEQRLERPVLLTGSGSTLFALYASGEAADLIARRLRSEPAFVTSRIIATRSTGLHVPTITSRRDP